MSLQTRCFAKVPPRAPACGCPRGLLGEVWCLQGHDFPGSPRHVLFTPLRSTGSEHKAEPNRATQTQTDQDINKKKQLDNMSRTNRTDTHTERNINKSKHKRSSTNTHRTGRKRKGKTEQHEQKKQNRHTNRTEQSEQRGHTAMGTLQWAPFNDHTAVGTLQ